MKTFLFTLALLFHVLLILSPSDEASFPADKRKGAA
ncbi:MAG: hypothetical protein K0S33_436 [Bacteroidetes bacterium]|nr:hypothetical protein [Bacteroidota bacterium]